MDTKQLGMIDEMACLIADAQKEMDDNSGIFEIRALAVLVVCLIPIVVCLLGVVAGLLRLKILSCCIAFQLGWPLDTLNPSSGKFHQAEQDPIRETSVTRQSSGQRRPSFNRTVKMTQLPTWRSLVHTRRPSLNDHFDDPAQH